MCTPFAHPNPAISARLGLIIGGLSGPVGLEAIFRISGFWPRRFVGLGSLDPNTFGYPSGTPLLPFSIAIGLISSRLDRRVFRSAACRGARKNVRNETLARAAPAGSLRALLFSGYNKPYSHAGTDRSPGPNPEAGRNPRREDGGADRRCQGCRRQDCQW